MMFSSLFQHSWAYWKGETSKICHLPAKLLCVLEFKAAHAATSVHHPPQLLIVFGV